jgi:type I restriction enzyme, S subunit
MNELPRGWAWAALGEVGRWLGGGTPSKSVADYWEGDIPWVSPKDMKVERIVDTEDHISHDAVEESATNLVPPGAVLVVTRSGILRHMLPVAVADRHVALNQDLKALIPADEIDPSYIAWVLRANADNILRECSKAGTTVSNIETRRLLAFKIPVAPLAEQRRIVASIEQDLSWLDTALQDLTHAERRLSQFRAAVLTEAMASWTERPLGDFSRIFVGTTPSRSRPDLWGGGVPWVSSGEVAFCRITATRETIAPEAVSAERVHPPGTVLLAMIGEGRTRGQAAVLDVGAAHNQNSAAIRLDASVCVHDWLFYVLMARYEETRAVGSGGQQPALNSARVATLRIPLPPLDKQHALVGLIEKRLSAASALELAVQRTSQRASLLRSAALASAFRGELVPQDPEDEPASVLVERIASGRGATPAPARTRRARTLA